MVKFQLLEITPAQIFIIPQRIIPQAAQIERTSISTIKNQKRMKQDKDH